MLINNISYLIAFVKHPAILMQCWPACGGQGIDRLAVADVAKPHGMDDFSFRGVPHDHGCKKWKDGRVDEWKDGAAAPHAALSAA